MATTEGGHASTTPGGDAATFADFLRRVCAGDESAATELVQRYEPALRLEVQFRLTDPKLRRLPGPGRPVPVGTEELFHPGGDRPVRAGQSGEALGPASGNGAEQDRPRGAEAEGAAATTSPRREPRRARSVRDRPKPEPEPAGDRPGTARCIPEKALDRGAADGRPPHPPVTIGPRSPRIWAERPRPAGSRCRRRQAGIRGARPGRDVG